MVKSQQELPQKAPVNKPQVQMAKLLSHDPAHHQIPVKQVHPSVEQANKDRSSNIFKDEQATSRPVYSINQKKFETQIKFGGDDAYQPASNENLLETIATTSPPIVSAGVGQPAVHRPSTRVIFC